MIYKFYDNTLDLYLYMAGKPPIRNLDHITMEEVQQLLGDDRVVASVGEGNKSQK